MVTFAQIIGLWPTRTAFAIDIGVTQQAVTNMIARDSIPARYWLAVMAAADRRCIAGVNLATLAQAASKEVAE